VLLAASFALAALDCAQPSPGAALVTAEVVPVSPASASTSAVPIEPSKPTATVSVVCDVKNPTWVILVPNGENPGERLAREQQEGTCCGGPLQPVRRPQGDPRTAYPPERCDGRTATLERPAGDWHLAVIYDGGWAYPHGGPNKTIALRPGESIRLVYSEQDFPQLGACCHCPFVSAFDPARGRDREAFEVLGGRSSAARAGTDRYPMRVPVRGGRIVLHLREIEDEVSFVRSVALETRRGATLRPIAPPPPVLRKGDEATLTFVDPSAQDGEIDVVLVVTGHYEPIL
jgi:hypothetical protein